MCFSLAWAEQLCIWIVIVIAIYSIYKLVVPLLLSFIGIPLIGQIIDIVVWAVIAIMAIIIIFMLLGCLFGGISGAMHFPVPR